MHIAVANETLWNQQSTLAAFTNWFYKNLRKKSPDCCVMLIEINPHETNPVQGIMNIDQKVVLVLLFIYTELKKKILEQYKSFMYKYITS